MSIITSSLKSLKVWRLNQCYEAMNIVSQSENPNSAEYFFSNSKHLSCWITNVCKYPQFEKLEKCVERQGGKPGFPAVMGNSLASEVPNHGRQSMTLCCTGLYLHSEVDST